MKKTIKLIELDSDYRLNRILSGTLKASASQVFKVEVSDE